MYSPDDFDELLSNPRRGRSDGLSADAALRERVLTRTTGVLRNRRRMKRLGVAAALAGCYLAGILTMSLVRAPATTAPGSAVGLTARVQPISTHDEGELTPIRARVRTEDETSILGAATRPGRLTAMGWVKAAPGVDNQRTDTDDKPASPSLSPGTYLDLLRFEQEG